MRGLFETPNGPAQPAAVNNVETLANVPHILANGADWFRSFGTEDSPGTMVCTVGGDVVVEAVAEVELGTPLRWLIDEIGGGTRPGRRVKMILSGVSNAPLTAQDLEAPISFEGMRGVGSGLGSAGFIVYDDTACAMSVAAAASAFLYRGSCGQCPPSKLGTQAITERFRSIALGAGSVRDLDEIAAWSIRVTDANRCGLGAGQQALARGHHRAILRRRRSSHRRRGLPERSIGCDHNDRGLGRGGGPVRLLPARVRRHARRLSCRLTDPAVRGLRHAGTNPPDSAAVLVAVLRPSGTSQRFFAPESVNPGARVFTRIPSGPSSRAMARVIATTAPLDAT